ncbi:hypothetical protein SM033_00233 [Vibrio phage vB_VpaM_sm033]|nr:hypothetical protein SM033_00233 [Vibrio phage vB_VpaM_sm033]
MALFSTLFAWSKSKAGLINLSIYVIIAIVAYLGFLRWEKMSAERQAFETANMALSIQIEELGKKLEIEREVADRLMKAQETTRIEKEIALDRLERERNENTGDYDRGTVAAILCANGYAEDSACQEALAPESTE